MNCDEMHILTISLIITRHTDRIYSNIRISVIDTKLVLHMESHCEYVKIKSLADGANLTTFGYSEQ